MASDWHLRYTSVYVSGVLVNPTYPLPQSTGSSVHQGAVNTAVKPDQGFLGAWAECNDRNHPITQFYSLLFHPTVVHSSPSRDDLSQATIPNFSMGIWGIPKPVEPQCFQCIVRLPWCLCKFDMPETSYSEGAWVLYVPKASLCSGKRPIRTYTSDWC